jgi:phthiocerol/phenolphthiocerol synthesis type-I polyketide synthase E
MTGAVAISRNEIEQVVAGIWQKLLGLEAIGRYDNFFQLGGDALLATRLLSKLRQLYGQAELSWRNLHEQPTVAGLAQLIEQTYVPAHGPQFQPIRECFLAAQSSERCRLIEAYLKKKIAHALGIGVDRLPANGSLAEIHLEAIAADLIWDFRGDFQLAIYRHEILTRPSIGLLTLFITTELERRYRLWPIGAHSSPIHYHHLQWPQKQKVEPQEPTSTVKNSSLIFLLCAPRSGSTLLRLMLAGHSALFCPPELSLLEHKTLQEWLQKRLLRFPKESGVVHKLIALMGFNEEQCQALINEPRSQAMSVQEIYRLIQQQATPRLLVDKTPSYAKNVETLWRAEAWFDEPKYIHLVRHPYAVIESFVRHRFEKFIGEDGVDPYIYAEQVWAERNSNIMNFSRELNPQRYYLVWYEDLVRKPTKTMQDLCEFLNLPFEEAILHPYDAGRMIGGPGDFDIFQHDGIDPTLGEIWRTISLPRPLEEYTQYLAAQFNYELPSAFC